MVTARQMLMDAFQRLKASAKPPADDATADDLSEIKDVPVIG